MTPNLSQPFGYQHYSLAKDAALRFVKEEPSKMFIVYHNWQKQYCWSTGLFCNGVYMTFTSVKGIAKVNSKGKIVFITEKKKIQEILDSVEHKCMIRGSF